MNTSTYCICTKCIRMVARDKGQKLGGRMEENGANK